MPWDETAILCGFHRDYLNIYKAEYYRLSAGTYTNSGSTLVSSSPTVKLSK